MRLLHETIVAMDKHKLSHILSVFVALGMQHAMRMPSEACPALPYFPHYLINGTICERKIFLTQMICFDFPCNLYHDKKQ